ncbi:MAG TPA: isoprenylcysteine carboxylmethyltransferase family protein [Paracoccaceae bacterium]|nr:isoprenylcysteine carboxylmethyltransferase family protein [Paracoccaceae bacterium]
MTQGKRGMAWIDLPPVWLALALGCVWAVDAAVPVAGLGPAGQGAGAVLVVLGLGLMAVAVVQMVVARTTVIPRRDPSRLMTGGVFAISRNPIYLGDALILAGAILWWDAWLALPLLAAFVVLIDRRFIRDEEARLRAAFGPEFDEWAARTGRWVGTVSRKGANDRN